MPSPFSSAGGPSTSRSTGETIKTPPPRLIGLKTPILIDALPMDVSEDLLESMLKAATEMGTRLTVRLDRDGTLWLET